MILVIDDSEVIRALLTDYLTDMGHDIETAEDGEEGLQKALQGEWDLVICDLHLPKRNGFEVMSGMGSQRGSLPFIFTDSLPDHIHDQIAEKTDCPCLRKPFDLEQFRAVLHETLDRVKTT